MNWLLLCLIFISNVSLADVDLVPSEQAYDAYVKEGWDENGEYKQAIELMNARNFPEVLKCDPIYLTRGLALSGESKAQGELGKFYEDGLNMHKVKKNYETAYKWYLLSANQGDAVAQYSVAMFNIKGLGVSQNLSNGLKYLRLSAGQKYHQAEKILGLLSRKGLAEKVDEKYEDYYTEDTSSDSKTGGYEPDSDKIFIIQNFENLKPKLSPSNHSMNSSKFDSAKKDCIKLGFKPKTEKFGKCVLELSK